LVVIEKMVKPEEVWDILRRVTAHLAHDVYRF